MILFDTPLISKYYVSVFALLGRFFSSCLHAGLREGFYVLVGSFFLIVIKFGA